MEQAKPTTAVTTATEALAEQVAELRAALAAQQATIAELERRMLTAQPATLAAVAPDASGTPAASAPDDSVRQRGARRGTSRRGLLRGAAAGAAAAAVAAVAVGAAEQAHAAPEASGDNFILGQPNSASSPTILSITGGLQVGMEVSSDALTTLAVTTYGNVAVEGEDTARFITTGMGVQGLSAYGVGLAGSSGSYLDIWASGTGRILQRMQGAVGAPTSGTYNAGESIRDANGDLWLCIAGDNTTLGTWVKVAHLAPGATSGGAVTYLSKPIRLLDTRPGQPRRPLRRRQHHHHHRRGRPLQHRPGPHQLCGRHRQPDGHRWLRQRWLCVAHAPRCRVSRHRQPGI